MQDLTTTHLYVRGRGIATLLELQTYLYEVPEDRVPSTVLTRFTAGQEVDPAELYAALSGADRDTVDGSDTALEILEILKRRLREAFPADIDAGSGNS